MSFGTNNTSIRISSISPDFTVGGHKWCVWCNNVGRSIGLCLLHECRDSRVVIVNYEFSLLDKHSFLSSTTSRRASRTFSPEKTSHGFPNFISTPDLEENFLKNSCFVINCSITIIKKPCLQLPKTGFAGIFPFNLHENLGKLLKNKEGTDVTFEVDGKLFAAHRLILAARSSVFKAELFGSMAEAKLKRIKLEDISVQPSRLFLTSCTLIVCPSSRSLSVFKLLMPVLLQ